MYFSCDDINSLLDGVSLRRRDTEIEEALGALAPRLAVERREHRHFGPFWWWIKPLLRALPGSRRSWVRGGYRDRALVSGVEGNDDSPLATIPGSEEERTRWIAWLGLRYYESEIVDDAPAGFHIVETTPRRVASYQLHDADASHQIDLFEQTVEDSVEVRDLLRDPTRFSASVWLRRADEYLAAGDSWRAASALRRAISHAVDDGDRSRGWLQLGTLFQQMNHVHKAIFCYRNAFEREQEAWVQGLMGEAWMEAGEPHEALPCYRAALEAMPSNPEYRSGLERAEQMLAERVGRYNPLPDRLAL